MEEAFAILDKQIQDAENAAEAQCLSMELALYRTVPDYN